MGIQNKKYFASILFVLISFVCMAQEAGDGITPPPGTPPPPGLMPIDGGLLLLLLAGLFYGIKNKLK